MKELNKLKQELLIMKTKNINGNSYRLKDKLKIDSDISEPKHC